MDLFDVVKSCFRRWYVVLPLLLLAAWYSHDVYTSVKPVYYSNAAISIAPPNTRVEVAAEGAPVPRNGLLDIGGGSLIANLAVFALRDPAVVSQVVAAGGRPNYTSKMFPVTSGMPELPLIMIEATEPNPTAATKTVESVVAQAEPTLRTLQQQAGVPDDQMVRPLLVSPPSAPKAGMPSRTRSTIAVFAAGAGLAILFGVVLDVLIIRWKARRRKTKQTAQNHQEPPLQTENAGTLHARNTHAADEAAMDA